jgi:hypothetical protein
MEKMFINLTHHNIVLRNKDGELKTIKPSGVIARVQFNIVEIDSVDGIPVVRVDYEEPVGLPEPKEGVYYIVSATVKNAVGDSRKDVVAAYSVERINGKPAYAKGVRING